MSLARQSQNKNSTTLRHIASELLSKQPGDRLDTIVSYAERLDVARGTVQNAIWTLKDAGAIKIASRGHMGTFISKLDYRILMEICQRGTFWGTLPLPYSLRYEGLATGLLTAFEDSNIDLGLGFMSGADRRVTALCDGRYEFAIVSSSSAYFYLKEGFPICIFYEFPPHSYINCHYLITRHGYAPKEDEVIKIGVDKTSHDQMAWIKYLFRNKKTELIPVQYIHIVEHILNGVIDAAVWNIEEEPDNSIVDVVPLQDEEVFPHLSSASIVMRNDDFATINAFNRFIDPLRIESIQTKVMSGELLPNY